MDLNLLQPIVTALALVLGGWIARRITSPRAHERAQLLAQIAADAAALIVATHPKMAWTQLLTEVVRVVSAAAGVPTRNAGAIERAAAGALKTLGKLPTS